MSANNRANPRQYRQQMTRFSRQTIDGSRVVQIIALLLSLANSPVWAAAEQPSGEADQLIQRGLEAYQQGAAQEAAEFWAGAANAGQRAGQPRVQVEALIRLAEVQKQQGFYLEAGETITRALVLAEQLGDPPLIASCLGSQGGTLALMGQTDKARNALEEGLEWANRAHASALKARIQNDLGNLYLSLEDHENALRSYRDSARSAEYADAPSLVARASANAAQAALLAGDSSVSLEWLATTAKTVERLDETPEKALLLLKLGHLLLRSGRAVPEMRAILDARAYQALQRAAEIARPLGDSRALSTAYGYLGQLYADNRRYDEALQLISQAAFYAQLANAPELLYQWQWSEARIYNTTGARTASLAAYRKAVQTVQSFRHDLLSSHSLRSGPLEDGISAVFLELADLLLVEAGQQDDPKRAETLLAEARTTIELLKATELQDYFEDECLLLARSRLKTLDETISASTAVVYPVMLPDRLEILLTLPDGLKHVTVDIPKEQLSAHVRRFRAQLEKRTTRQYLREAQRLYEWLIAPIEEDLAANNIDTLVFVPDALLATIPMSALNDGDAPLVARYAIATTPGLALTDPKPIPRDNVTALLTGLTTSVQGFPPLKHVSAELTAVESMYGGDRLQDEDFVAPKVETELSEKQFSVVHIASHGRFERNVRNSFVLTFDDRLTMDDLEKAVALNQVRDLPVELLTLSACQTAAGDERAALGLAGVTVKAGARSALATLWFINDPATTLLVSEFYRELRDPSVTKAEALRRAQLILMDDPRYAHPAYWSPFLLIGNWR
jgi:CHAT domain-containing protein